MLFSPLQTSARVAVKAITKTALASISAKERSRNEMTVTRQCLASSACLSIEPGVLEKKREAID